MIVSSEILHALVLLAAIGCGLVAGVFFAFSTFVMKALARVSTEAGVAAMQAINVTVLGPWFMTAFFGSGVICVVVLIQSLIQWGKSGTLYLLVGSMCYLVGSILVTIAFNVPRNRRLGALSLAAGDVEQQWLNYISSWTAWNHVRTAASIVAATSFCLALGSGT